MNFAERRKPVGRRLAGRAVVLVAAMTAVLGCDPPAGHDFSRCVARQVLLRDQTVIDFHDCPVPANHWRVKWLRFTRQSTPGTASVSVLMASNRPLNEVPVGLHADIVGYGLQRHLALTLVLPPEAAIDEWQSQGWVGERSLHGTVLTYRQGRDEAQQHGMMTAR